MPSPFTVFDTDVPRRPSVDLGEHRDPEAGRHRLLRCRRHRGHGRASSPDRRGSRCSRTAIGSMITGLQTMPSVAWVPLTRSSCSTKARALIMFVVVLGRGAVDCQRHHRRHRPRPADPSSSGSRFSAPPRVQGVALRRDPGRAAVGRGHGLKQGRAYTWRSLMAGRSRRSYRVTPGIGQLLNGASTQIGLRRRVGKR